ncbi:MAG TPA: O-antigen ligase family protein [Candidatus Acidoferrales bacterium]|nr:O-antigen ligase family protein [Candidatus Acidoferrales bacterium]
MFPFLALVAAAPRHPLDAIAVAAYTGVFLACVLLGVRRPAFAVAAMIALDPFHLSRDIGPTTITLPKAALIGTALGLFIRRAPIRVLTQPAALLLLIGGVLIALTTALSITQAQYPLEALRQTFKAVEFLALFAVVVVALRADPDEDCVRLATAVTLVVVSVAAITQEFGTAPSVLRYGTEIIPRIAGPLEGPNQLAGYDGIALPVIAAFMLLRRPLLWEFAALGLGITALLLTFSRAGILTTLPALALVVVLAPSERRRTVAFLSAAASFAGLAVLVARAKTVAVLWHFGLIRNDYSAGGVGDRSILWHAALTLWRMHPWLGIGAGNFEFEIATVGPRGVKTHANSLYLQSLVEGGLPLLAAQLYTTAASVMAFLRRSLREPLLLGAWIGSAALAAHQIVDFLVFYAKVGGMWWIVLGLAAARAGTIEERCGKTN